MASSANNEDYERQKKIVIEKKKDKNINPDDVYKLAPLLARWAVNDTLPICLLCQDVSATAKKITQLGHLFPHSILNEADRGTTTPTMPKQYKRFAVGKFMKAKRELVIEAAQEKASCLAEIKNEQQNLRRLKAKENQLKESNVAYDLGKENVIKQQKTRSPTNLKDPVPSTSARRNTETLEAAAKIHGASKRNKRPALDGLFDTLQKRCKISELGSQENCFDYIRGTPFGSSRMGYRAFCPDCEKKFQQGEDYLNKEFFKPFFHNPSEEIKGEVLIEKEEKNFPWLFHSFISIAWRCMCFIPANHRFIEVLECLRRYLMDWTNSEEIHSNIRLFVFAPNKKIDEELEVRKDGNSNFFYKMFHARVADLTGGLRLWIFCGPLHIVIQAIQADNDHSCFSEEANTCILNSKMKDFVIPSNNKRYFPLELYDNIVSMGSSILSSTTRFDHKTNKASSSNEVVEAMYLHVLPNNVSYSKTKEEFSYSTKIYTHKFTITSEEGKIKYVGVTRGKQEKIIFVAIRNGLANGGEIAMGLNVHDDNTVSYMKDAKMPQNVIFKQDLTILPFKGQIEQSISKYISDDLWS